MLFTEIIPLGNLPKPRLTQIALLAFWLVLVGSLHAWSIDRAYYSNGDSITVRPAGRSRVVVAPQLTPGVVPTSLVATVSEPFISIFGSGAAAVVRIGLNGVAPAGYRAGILVSATGVLSLSALETVTLRTYLGETLQETEIVKASLLDVDLLASNGYPQQLEFAFPTTKKFSKVEVEFNPAGLLSINLFGGVATKILYAYGVTQGETKVLTGYLSQFVNPISSQYTTATGTSLPIALCVNNAVVNPIQAVDDDLTNYAYFSNTLSVGCTSFLKVDLNGRAEAVGYRAGFVIGSSGLVGVGLLTDIQLRTYLDGVPQEVSGALSLVNVTLLADGQSFISFKTTKAFNQVSIERGSTAAVFDNLRLYFGFGLPEAVFTNWGPPIITSLPISEREFVVSQSATVCIGCTAYIITPANGSAPYIMLNNGIAVGVANNVRFTKLTGPGLAGYRAGVVLGVNTLADVSVLDDLILATYDANGQLLETATSEFLLAVNILPDNRREISFRTTRNFAQIGVFVNSTIAAISNINVYSAFADERGLIQIIPPAGPLPVVLTSFAVARATGATAADVAWATASERNSAYFLVERTTDPQAGFTVIGRVAAAGTSTASHQYSLRDAAAPTRVTSYYRLRQVDIDGTQTLSPVVALAATDAVASGFALYPNPAPAGAVSLSLGTSIADGSVVVYSTVGQVVRCQAVSSASGQPDPTLSTKGLPNGIYQVVLRDASGQSLGTQRLVIAN